MDQTSVISLDTIKFLTSDGLKLFTNNILSIIEDNEYVTATAITDLNDRLLIVENNNSGSIITEADITAWGFTKNTGTITGVSAYGTSVATSGVANIPAASTSVYGVTKLSDATNSTSITLAATANAVKKAYDLANSYKGTITGVSANGTSVATSGVANIPAASTSVYGVTKLSSATNSTSTTLAATASAVKAAYDLANSYKGTVTSIKLNHMTYTPTDGLIEANVAQMVTLNGSTIIPNTIGAIPLGNLATEDALNNVLTIIEDNEYVTATAITDLNDRLLIVENNNSGSIITEDTILAWGFTKNTGTYSKPSGGIPKSDLASAVQTSLGKADTALQSYTEQYTGTITGVSANGTSVATSGVANIPAATTSKYGVTKLSSSTSSSSTSLAATASAVKAAYDLANTYKGTVTSITINGTTKNQTNGVIDLGTIPTEDSINNILTIIEDNEYVTATAITDLNERITNLELNGGGGSSGANIQAVDTGDVIDDVTIDYATKTYVDGLIGDINSVLESIINGGGSISLITFTLDGTEYQAEEGMTYMEWINSAYNTAGYGCDAWGMCYGPKGCLGGFNPQYVLSNGDSFRFNEPY